MTVQFQFFQSLPNKKADFVKKKPIELGVVCFIGDISGQVVELKKSSAGDGFLGAGWSVAGLKFDAGQGGGGGRSLLYISCIVPTNPPEQPAQCDVPRRSLKISTARTGPAEAVELCAQSSA